VTAKTFRPIMDERIAMATRTVSDGRCTRSSWRAGEYVRGDIHTNTVESYFSIMKRGIFDVYHHVSAQHLKRYLAEFDFRYNERVALKVTDVERAAKAVAGVVGKRMTYQRSASRQNRLPVSGSRPARALPAARPAPAFFLFP
jgi:hypothetical protein